MKKIIIATSIALSANTFAQVTVSDCIIQETIPGAKVTGAFMNMNFEKQDKDVALISASIPSITKKIEIHEMIMANGSMKMSEIKSFPLAEGKNEFRKGGYHVMLMDIENNPKVGETHKITLNFDNAESVSCDAVVKTPEELAKLMPSKKMDMNSKMDNVKTDMTEDTKNKMKEMQDGAKAKVKEMTEESQEKLKEEAKKQLEEATK